MERLTQAEKDLMQNALETWAKAEEDAAKDAECYDMAEAKEHKAEANKTRALLLKLGLSN